MSLLFSLDYGPIILDLNYFYTSVLLVIVGVIMKAVLENTIVYLFIGLVMKVCSVIATEKASCIIFYIKTFDCKNTWLQKSLKNRNNICNYICNAVNFWQGYDAIWLSSTKLFSVVKTLHPYCLLRSGRRPYVGCWPCV